MSAAQLPGFVAATRLSTSSSLPFSSPSWSSAFQLNTGTSPQPSIDTFSSASGSKPYATKAFKRLQSLRSDSALTNRPIFALSSTTMTLPLECTTL